MTAPDPLGSATPGFIDGDGASPAASDQPVAVGSADHTAIGTGTATYDNDLSRPDGCLFNGVATGLLVTVVNVDNGRSVVCWTAARLEDGAPWDEVVLSAQAFRQIADPTDAPIHVEIRQ